SLKLQINKADFTCPSWFSSSAKNLIKRILDPNPLTRITIPDILENEWFKKGYRPPDFEQGEDVSLDDVVAVFNDSKMKLKGDKTGRKGHLSVATEVSVTIDGCQEKILPFSGRSGLYIEGSVSPPISGVDIRVVTADNSGDAPLQKGELVLETTTEPDGFFIGGPLYDDADTRLRLQSSVII
ncbi:hypothetical protein IFM89_030817, partial [Coptis chinensis]